MSLGHGASVVRDGLVLHLDAANTKSYPGSGSTWFDLSGNGNHVSIVNSPTYTSNNKGSFIFDGVDEYLGDITITNSGFVTAIFLAKYESKSSYHNFYDSLAQDPMFWIRPNDTLELNKSDGAVTVDIFTNEIHMFTTISESAGESTIYVDTTLNKLDISGADTFSTTLTIDLLNRNGGETFKGELFCIMFYNRALSASEIKQNFEAMRGRYGI